MLESGVQSPGTNRMDGALFHDIKKCEMNKVALADMYVTVRECVVIGRFVTV